MNRQQVAVMNILFSFRNIALACMLLFAAACKQGALYERLANIPQGQWQRSYVPQFTFEITDTTVHYKIYVVVRHTNNYPFRNVWMNIGIANPQDSVKTQQFELPLAANDKWLGVGMDDVFERRILLLPNPVKFAKTGSITFTLQHTMRRDPLPFVLQAGIRVEPVSD